MKGVVFTEFMEMIETNYGEDRLEEVIDASGLEAVYSSIGTYPHSEMVKLVTVLSEQTNTPVPELLEAFGKYMFSSFTRLYPGFFEKAQSAFDFLERVEDYIHVEVKKIYPEAELPQFQTERLSEFMLKMEYRSDRSMGTLAIGLIQGCLNHFGEKGTVEMEVVKEDGSMVNFLITLDK